MRLRTIGHKMGRLTPGYRWGGGHEKAIHLLKWTDGMDCSGATSFALYKAGFWGERTWALTSSDFYKWGVPGYGRTFTVMYKPRGWLRPHVYIKYHGQRGPLRLDTSPWGSRAGSGPRMRRTPRSEVGFKPRHWPGH
jgi:hypothetical protein